MAGDNLSVTIGFKTTKYEADKFKQKCPSRGRRSKILRALLQQYLNGQIHGLVYKVEEKLS